MKLALPFWILLATYTLMSAFLVPALFEIELSMLLPYKWHKLLHLVGVVVFMGNVAVSGVWSAMALRMNRPAFTRFSIRTLVWADAIFTGPGFLLAVANGVFMVAPWGGIYGGNWLIATLILLGVSGTLSCAVIPLQIKLWRMCEGEWDDPIPEGFERTMKAWSVWGTITLLPLLGIVGVMVLKPWP